jgi:hypothetical protein
VLHPDYLKAALNLLKRSDLWREMRKTYWTDKGRYNAIRRRALALIRAAPDSVRRAAIFKAIDA